MVIKEKDDGETKVSVDFNTPQGKYIIGSDTFFVLDKDISDNTQSKLEYFVEKILKCRKMLENMSNEDIKRL